MIDYEEIARTGATQLPVRANSGETDSIHAVARAMKISRDELRIGMYIIRPVGAWVKHDLWRNNFLITDTATLHRVRHCGAEAFLIDPRLGEAPPAATALTTLETIPETSVSPLPVSAASSNDLRTELHRARSVCNAARGTVFALFECARCGQALDLRDAEAAVDAILESVERNANALLQLTRLRREGDYTHMHSVAVCVLMASLAKAKGFDVQSCQSIALGGLLHDIGKALVPVEILNKPGKLTSDEFKQVKEHARQGYQLLVDTGGVDAVALEVCLHHHEKSDRTGYPDGLDSEQITVPARMGAICDVFDAVTSTRPYKAAWDPGEALRYMAKPQAAFDRAILAEFVKIVGIYPTGSLVRLVSGRLAIVVENRSHALHKPIVRVFYSTRSGTSIPLENIDLNTAGTGEAIQAREPREAWTETYLRSLEASAAAD